MPGLWPALCQPYWQDRQAGIFALPGRVPRMRIGARKPAYPVVFELSRFALKEEKRAGKRSLYRSCIDLGGVHTRKLVSASRIQVPGLCRRSGRSLAPCPVRPPGRCRTGVHDVWRNCPRGLRQLSGPRSTSVPKSESVCKCAVCAGTGRSIRGSYNPIWRAEPARPFLSTSHYWGCGALGLGMPPSGPLR